MTFKSAKLILLIFSTVKSITQMNTKQHKKKDISKSNDMEIMPAVLLSLEYDIIAIIDERMISIPLNIISIPIVIGQCTAGFKSFYVKYLLKPSNINTAPRIK